MLQSTFLIFTLKKDASMNNIFVQLFPLIVLFAIFYFIIIRPQIKQQKAHKEMFLNLKKGDKVILSGGIIAEISKIDEHFISVKISDNTIVRIPKEKEFIYSKWEIPTNEVEQTK